MSSLSEIICNLKKEITVYLKKNGGQIQTISGWAMRCLWAWRWCCVQCCPGTQTCCVHRQQAITLLPLCPPAEVSSVPLRPHLPQNPYSAECPPHTTPCHSQPSSRPAHTCRPEARKTSSRNGAHSVRTTTMFPPAPPSHVSGDLSAST